MRWQICTHLTMCKFSPYKLSCEVKIGGGKQRNSSTVIYFEK